MSIYFIVNPIAGKGQGEAFVQEAEKIMKKRNISYEIAYTQYPGHAVQLVAQVDERKFSKVVAVGGDGTIYETINGMNRKYLTLGIIPTGTGNDLARSAEIPMDPIMALEVVLEGRERYIDIGNMNRSFFVNVAGVGLDVEVLRATEHFKSIFKGPIAYVLGVIKALYSFKPIRIDISIDGEKYREEIMLCAIANGKYYGGGMKIVPAAQLEDGFFTICFIRKMPKLKLLFLFPKVFKGNHINLPWVWFRLGKRVTIHSQEGIWVNADGEISKEYSPSFNILQEELKILVPKGSSSMVLAVNNE